MPPPKTLSESFDEAMEGRTPEAIAAEPWRILRAAGLEPDAWQESILMSGARQLAILGARQGAGKSTVAAALNVLACLPANRRAYIGGPSEDQSKEVLSKAADLLRNLGFVGTLVQEREIKATQIHFENGSFIKALSSNQATGRGKTAHLITITEAALASDALINALTPSLATTNGRLVLESTPFGQRGFFWQVWNDGTDDGSRCCPDGTVGVSASMPGWGVARRTANICTRISGSFIESEKEKGDMYYQQEYLCKFHAPDGSFFPMDAIERAFQDGVRPLFPESPWVKETYRPPSARLSMDVRPLLIGGRP